MPLPILPPPNHRGPRILLAGLLSVGVHAAALGLAGAFPAARPSAVEAIPEAPGPDEVPADFGPLPEDPGGLELPPPEDPVAPEMPVITLEAEELPPPSTASDDLTELTPVPRRSTVTAPTARLSAPVRTGAPISSALRGAAPGTGSGGSGAGAGTGGGGRWLTPKPPYPAQAKMMRQTGSGSVRIQTDSSGRVVRAEMVQSITPMLDNTTTNFARARWVGPPNRTVVVPVTFELR